MTHGKSKATGAKRGLHAKKPSSKKLAAADAKQRKIDQKINQLATLRKQLRATLNKLRAGMVLSDDERLVAQSWILEIKELKSNLIEQGVNPSLRKKATPSPKTGPKLNRRSSRASGGVGVYNLGPVPKFWR